MILFLSGVHGVGKTTLVNNLFINKPLIKITDIDFISDMTDNGFASQMKRFYQMKYVVDNLPNNVDVIMDRSPYDFLVYGREVISDKKQYDFFQSAVLAFINDCERKGMYTIFINDEFDNIWKRITERGRDYEEKKYTLKIYNGFKTNLYLRKVDSVDYEDAQEYINKLFY